MDALVVTDGAMIRVQSGSTRGVGLGLDRSGEYGMFADLSPGEARVIGQALLEAATEEELEKWQRNRGHRNGDW